MPPDVKVPKMAIYSNAACSTPCVGSFHSQKCLIVKKLTPRYIVEQQQLFDCQRICNYFNYLKTVLISSTRQ